MTITLPFMQRLALRLPELFQYELPILFSESHITLTREQVLFITPLII